MSLKLRVAESIDRLEKRLEALKYLAGHEVNVGLTEGASERNRFILAVQEHGSPVMRIPPRPVIRPGLAREETRAEMTEAMMEAVEAAQEGDVDGVRAGMERCGQAGADGIRAYIDAGIKPGNSPVTVNGGWIYNRVAKTGVPVGGKGFDKPLYETGELYGAFDYEVKEK